MVTFPNGKVYRFQPVFTTASSPEPITSDSFYFQPLFGTAPNCKLQTTDPGFLSEGVEEVTVSFEGTSGPVEVSSWNPQEFILTTEDGKKYKIKVGVGLESMTDLYGNVLTVSSTGIHHSSGKDITFTRDG